MFNQIGLFTKSLFCQICRKNLSALPVQSRRWNSNRASVTRINRSVYAKMYPTIMVLSDGSTINFRHAEPRKLLKLPLDWSTLSAEERALILARRKPKRKVIVKEDIEDDFDVNEYSHLWKKK